MISILAALVAYIGWGTGDIFIALTSRKIGGYSTSLFVVLASALGFSGYVLLNPGSVPQISLGMFALMLLIAFIGLVALTIFFEAFRWGNAMVVGTVAASFSALVVLFSAIFLGESITTPELMLIGVILTGVILSGVDLKSLRGEAKLFSKGVVLALIVMFLWGVNFTLIKIPIDAVGWLWPSVVGTFVFPLLLLYMRIMKIPVVKPDGKSWFYIILAVILLNLGQLAYNFGIEIGRVSIVAPIAGAYSTLFAVLAYFVFKDRIARQQVLGVIITLTGIVGLSFMGV